MLTFRNVHNWLEAGHLDATLQAVAPERMDAIGNWLLPLDTGTVGRAHSAVPLHHGTHDPSLIDTVAQRLPAFPSPLAGRLSDSHAPGLMGGIGLVFLCAGMASLAHLPGDASALRIVLSNLMGNAAKFTRRTAAPLPKRWAVMLMPSAPPAA